MKFRIIILMLVASLMSGCSLFESASQSLNYVTEATTYVKDVSTFAEKLPTLAQDTVTNSAALDQITSSFTQMKQDITEFNQLDAPAFAQDVHDKLIQYNETFLKEINTYISDLSSGSINLETIAQSEMMKTMNGITGLLNQVQQLGQ
ncbi:DUF6376 family protein [Paenibacillus sp. N1-5-1-14]|uniref:DUF6376 family protein n=1 Tax=Paenibacillus radicibacter TaxID=2972488 RepID=UPI0021596602|nr:DUF6376 family protein [Paenibacillus radicibacter]MCR8645431.1 DUF6376 family protein [Paenibacillus radicibacter]